jgi:L-threonylcarbamoyladenylate synthase
METRVIPADDPHALVSAVEVLQGGGLVAFPTDTVYGLGVNIDNPAGIEALFQVKGRDRSKAIPILLGDLADLDKVAIEVGNTALRLAQRFWPGALTLVVLRHASLPESLLPGPTAGVRMPNHPLTLALLRRTGPLAVTSANLSGEQSPSSAGEVSAQLGGRIALILDGGITPGGMPSTVVDCTGAELVILRQGPLSLHDLQMVLT